MALINWKQISEQLGDYGVLSGSLNISGSLIVNGVPLSIDPPADISSVNAGLGLSGGGESGSVTLTLDTGSTHFLNALANINNAGIFKQTGSFWSTTNNLQVTGSLTIGDGLFKLKEYTSTPTPEPGAIYYSASNFYFGMD